MFDIEFLDNPYMKMLIFLALISCLIMPQVLPVILLYVRGRDSSVGIATRYGLDGPGIESRWEARFPHPARLGLFRG